jgi:hypothetical protein
MSTFKRTRSGLSNQHLFYRVDFIVFVEGGCESYTKEQIISGFFHEETDDIIYWKNVFGCYLGSKKMKFKSVGSKSTIKEIAEDIVNDRIAAVVVAMDSEFDEVLERRIIHPKVVYTYGYSYENDVWNANVVKAVIEELIATDIDGRLIDKHFIAFWRAIRIAIYADSYLFSKGSSFFPRKSGFLFFLEFRADKIPLIRRTKILNRLSGIDISKGTFYTYGRRHNIYPQKHCFGHLLADYCCQLIIGYLKEFHDLVAPRKEILYRMGIRKYFQLYHTGSIVDSHHQRQLLPIFF